MYRGSLSRYVPFLVILVVAGVVILLGVSLFRAFIGDDGQGAADTSTATSQELLSTADGRSVRMTSRGPIVANEDVRTSEIEVAPSLRRAAYYSGYSANSLGSESYGNTSRSYEEFVYALDRAGLANIRELTPEQNIVRGVCADGSLYTFEILAAGTPVRTIWTSTCRGSGGTLRGDLDAVRGLFLDQVPDGSNIVRDLDI